MSVLYSSKRWYLLWFSLIITSVPYRNVTGTGVSDTKKCINDKTWRTQREYHDYKKVRVLGKKRAKIGTELKLGSNGEVELKQRDCKWVKFKPDTRCQTMGMDGIRANYACKKSCKSCQIDMPFDEYQAKHCGTKSKYDKKMYQGVMGGEYFCDRGTNSSCYVEPPRNVQYDTKTNMMYIIGEKWHGTDYENYANHWICGLSYVILPNTKLF